MAHQQVIAPGEKVFQIPGESYHESLVYHIKEKLRKEELKKREPRSKLNEWAKFIVSQANSIFTITGFVIMSGATYLLVADFGNLDKGFFIGGGIIFFLFGWIILGMSYLGCQGIYYQRKVSPYTKWQGTRILTFFQIFLVITVAAELTWLTVSMGALSALKENAELVLKGDNPDYTSLEDEFAAKFNPFFFGACSECASLRYAWFWSFVNKRCAKFDENMAQLSCQRCDDYSVTVCTADSYVCHNSDMIEKENFACPYNACREGVLDFVLDRFSPFAYFVLFVCVFQILLIASTCALICFHQRDSDAEIRAKNGIFVKGDNRAAGDGNNLATQGQHDRHHISHQPMAPPPPQHQQHQQQQQHQGAPQRSPRGPGRGPHMGAPVHGTPRGHAPPFPGQNHARPHPPPHAHAHALHANTPPPGPPRRAPPRGGPGPSTPRGHSAQHYHPPPHKG
jgi:hypothetical protein